MTMNYRQHIPGHHNAFGPRRGTTWRRRGVLYHEKSISPEQIILFELRQLAKLVRSPACVSVGVSLHGMHKKILNPFSDNRDIGWKAVLETAIYGPIDPVVHYPLTGPEYPDIRYLIVVEVACKGRIGWKAVLEPAIYGPIDPVVHYPLTGPEYWLSSWSLPTLFTRMQTAGE